MTKPNLTSEELFNFPCDYPVKVMGKDCDELSVTMRAIIERHAGKLHPNQISSKKSSKGSYISYTVRIVATSRAQLDSINQELQDNPLVAYIL
jgi:putative lipoic acid-binding regulatory protein